MLKVTDNKFLFSLEGRINRAKYIYAGFAGLSCGLVFLGALAFIIASLFGGGVKDIYLDYDIFDDFPSLPFRATFDADPHSAVLIRLLFYMLGAPIFIFSLWILAAATIKRLHDRNRSGWWILLFWLAPVLLGKIIHRWDDLDVLGLIGLIAIGLNIWAIVELIFLRGTKGPNRFGPDPLAPVDTRPPWDQRSEIEFAPHKAGPPVVTDRPSIIR